MPTCNYAIASKQANGRDNFLDLVVTRKLVLKLAKLVKHMDWAIFTSCKQSFVMTRNLKHCTRQRDFTLPLNLSANQA